MLHNKHLVGCDMSIATIPMSFVQNVHVNNHACIFPMYSTGNNFPEYLIMLIITAIADISNTHYA